MLFKQRAASAVFLQAIPRQSIGVQDEEQIEERITSHLLSRLVRKPLRRSRRKSILTQFLFQVLFHCNAKKEGRVDCAQEVYRSLAEGEGRVRQLHAARRSRIPELPYQSYQRNNPCRAEPGESKDLIEWSARGGECVKQ